MKLFDVYPIFNITPVKAAGSWVWDDKGIKYLDLYGGHAVISVGHNHPNYVKRLADQLYRIGFYSNSVRNPQQEELAARLAELSGYPNYNLFLVNSGAEANENALKVASFYNGRKKIVSFNKSFHGRTSCAVAVTDNKVIHAPLDSGHQTIFLPFNDCAAIKQLENPEEVCAVILEGIQGIGGIHVPTVGFLEEVRRFCDKNNVVLVLDEVQSGYGRTGKFFAHQHTAIQADIITMAKGMGNGFPIGGLLLHPKFQAKHGMLGSTFGGNYLACAAALAVLEIIKEENLQEHASQVGNYLIEQLKNQAGVKEVRGSGLMIGVELDYPIADLRNELLYDYKIFTGSSSNKNMLRILPPLNIKKEEADIFLKAFSLILGK